jgi:tetratricopeptide (TPR) repeat protein
MTDPVTPAVGGVFISYRRQETAPYARLLREELRRHLGAEQVFMDVDSIEVGVDFAEAIQQAVASCEVLLALVGPQWLTVTDANGRRRLEDPDDTVRLEIEAALARNIRVIPVLVDNTSMPQRQQLPESLAPLSRRNALELTYNRYGYDLERLLEAVGRVLGQRSTPVATPATSIPAATPAAAGAKGAGPPSIVELVSQAKTAHGRKRFQEALGHLDIALQLAPDDPDALLSRGATYIDLGRNEEALRDLDRTLQLAPDDPIALMNRGVAYMNLGYNEEALRDLDRALQLAPDDP